MRDIGTIAVAIAVVIGVAMVGPGLLVATHIGVAILGPTTTTLVEYLLFGPVVLLTTVVGGAVILGPPALFLMAVERYRQN
jgi:hypothetical protein